MMNAKLRTPIWIGTAVFTAILTWTTHAYADTLSELEIPFRDAVKSGNWGLALGLVFLAGLATAFTPCVYPMIVVTVGVFGARQSKTRLEGALLSSSFVLGIAVLFTSLGLVAATTGEMFGGTLSSPVVLIGIALLFVALAASMFGAFDIDLPPSLKTRLATVGGVGYKGAFLLGMASAIIAAPCAGPVLGFLLTWVGTTGDLLFGAVSLFVYALGLGLLFWVVGTFSVSLPKSGQWLEWFKSVFGIVMIVAAVYFVRNLIPGLRDFAERSSGFLIIAATATVAGIAIGAVHLSFHDSSMGRRFRKAMGIALATLGLCGILGYCEALPPGAKIEWLEDYKSAQKQALDRGSPLLVDFTASWCTACGELDRHTFSDPRIVRESQRFVSVRVDMSPLKDTPEKRAILKKYDQLGLPFVVIHDQMGREAVRFASFVEADKFLEAMRKVK